MTSESLRHIGIFFKGNIFTPTEQCGLDIGHCRVDIRPQRDVGVADNNIGAVLGGLPLPFPHWAKL